MDPAFTQQYAALQRDHWWFRGRQAVVERALDQALPAGGGLRLLSVGCGPRRNLGWLARRGRVVGVDVAAALGAGDGPPFACASILALPFRDGAFDGALALDVLEHVDDDVAAARELVRIVRPGGAVVVTVPALQALWGPHDEVNHHRRRYGPGALRRTLTAAGLRPRVTFFNTLLFPAVAGLRLARRLASALGLGGGAPASRSDCEGLGRPGPLAPLLGRVFALERHAVGRVPLPVGASLLAVAVRP